MFQDLIQDMIIHLLASPYTLLGHNNFPHFLFLIILKVLRSTSQVFCRLSLNGDLFDISLMITLGLWFGEDLSGKVPFSSNQINGTYYA